MNLAPRQQDILNLARERGYVSIDELAQAFAVTPQTIRRDINQLAEHGLLDIVSSDYVPNSLLESAFKLARDFPGIALPQAVAAVSSTPADAVGLNDRGAIEAGRRADLVRVRVVDGQPVVRAVWRDGERVA